MSVNMGLQLFPPPPPPRQKMPVVLNTINRPVNLQSAPISAVERARSPEIPDGRRSALSGHQSVLGAPVYTADNHGTTSPPNAAASPSVQLGAELPRSYTSFSDAPTLVRSQSSTSHYSVPMPRFLNSSPSEAGSNGEPAIRSIFPRYIPSLPLEQQPYYPAQPSPTYIPRSTVSSGASRSPAFEDRLRCPSSAPPTMGRFPRGVHDVLAAPRPSSTDELKDLWKVTNGWRAPMSEGRTFCLKMTSAIEIPVHTLSSTTHPFYTLRLNPTSTSSHLRLTRHDPSKALKGGGLQKKIGRSVAGTEVVSTMVEESARRLPPNDGLVALLYPRAAADMVVDLTSKSNGPDAEAIMEVAERECGQLFWDDEGKKYYLLHPAMTTPFEILISSSPAWSRVEYTLEHPELPKYLVKLTRDGSGGGFLEVDTGIAAQVDCFYIVDVAICATLLVAVTEERLKNVERFDAPPASVLVSNVSKNKKSGKVEAMDIESQSSLTLDKEKANLSRPRGVLGLLYLACRFVIWLLRATVNAAAGIAKQIR